MARSIPLKLNLAMLINLEPDDSEHMFINHPNWWYIGNSPRVTSFSSRCGLQALNLDLLLLLLL